MEKGLRSVSFTFEDGQRLILQGLDLETWETICLSHSDYLLPGDETHILASGYGGAVQGFVPPSAITRAGAPRTAG